MARGVGTKDNILIRKWFSINFPLRNGPSTLPLRHYACVQLELTKLIFCFFYFFPSADINNKWSLSDPVLKTVAKPARQFTPAVQIFLCL